MRLLDFVLLFCCLALADVFFLLGSGRGKFVLRPVWNRPLEPSEYENGHSPSEAEMLPQPIVTTLRPGRGQDIVVATRDPFVEIYSWNSKTGVPELRFQASLMTPQIKVRRGRYPVALQTGFLDPAQAQQYIVVVTDSLSVLCFDLTLRLIWESSVGADIPEGHYLREVGVLVSPVEMRSGDLGVVVVGTRIGGRDSHVGFGHAHQRSKRSAVLDDDDAPKIVQEEEESDSETHFSFYAFDGRTGMLRWQHEAEEFSDGDDEELKPQHPYLVSKGLHHSSKQMDWRQFRWSVLKQLPHFWTGRGDTRLVLAHFEKSWSYAAVDSGGMRSKSQASGSTTGLTGKAPNVIVAHTKEGIEVVHLYSGRSVCSLRLRRGSRGGVFVDLNGDGVIDFVEGVEGDDSVFRRKGQVFVSPRCFGRVSSGLTPPFVPLFDGSLIHKGSVSALGSRSRGDRTPVYKQLGLQNEDLRIMQPLVLEQPQSNTKKTVVFMIAAGKVTAFDESGRLQFQVSTECRSNLRPRIPEHDVIEESWYSGLSALSLSADIASAPMIVAHGYNALVLLRPHTGNVLATVDLHEPSVGQSVFGDFNNDGLNDIIVAGRSGFAGYTLQAGGGSFSFPALAVSILLVLLAGLIIRSRSPPIERWGRRIAKVRADRHDTDAQVRYGQHMD